MFCRSGSKDRNFAKSKNGRSEEDIYDVIQDRWEHFGPLKTFFGFWNSIPCFAGPVAVQATKVHWRVHSHHKVQLHRRPCGKCARTRQTWRHQRRCHKLIHRLCTIGWKHRPMHSRDCKRQRSLILDLVRIAFLTSALPTPPSQSCFPFFEFPPFSVFVIISGKYCCHK